LLHVERERSRGRRRGSVVLESWGRRGRRRPRNRWWTLIVLVWIHEIESEARRLLSEINKFGLAANATFTSQSGSCPIAPCTRRSFHQAGDFIGWRQAKHRKSIYHFRGPKSVGCARLHFGASATTRVDSCSACVSRLHRLEFGQMSEHRVSDRNSQGPRK
jgi:hypothetical protein